MKRRIFDYVRDSYGVPAYRGARVWYCGVEGRIVHASNYVFVKFAKTDALGTDLERYIPKGKDTHFKLTLHPCERGLCYDVNTPVSKRPSGNGYHVWGEVCANRGVNMYSDEGLAIARSMGYATR